MTWSPWRHLREWYPDVRVIETELAWRVLGCHDAGRRIIWLDDRLTAAEQRCTLAYQVGHLELGPFDPDVGDDGMVDDWASRLLIPFDDLLQSCRRFEALADVAQELWVDVSMLKARLRGLTDAEQVLVAVDRWHADS